MPSLCQARLGPPPPPPRGPRDHHQGSLPAYCHAHPHRHSSQPMPPMMMMPPPHPHFHYPPYHRHHGPPLSGIMYGPSADLESHHAEAVHRWQYERAATGTGDFRSANRKSEEDQDIKRNDHDEQVKEEGTQHVHEHKHEHNRESVCKSSPSQDDMYENALLLASLATSPGKDISSPRLEDRGNLGQNDDLVPQNPPRQPQPQLQAEPPQDQIRAAIPRPNIVTPVSSERQFVEELHHHHRVELSPPDQSFYQRQEGAGDQSGTSHPSIFRTPQKKRENAGSPTGSAEDQSALKAKKKMRSVYHQHPVYPPANGFFVSPGPLPPFPKEGTGDEYPPPPYPFPYPRGQTPRFGSGRGHRDREDEEELSPRRRSSPSYPPAAFPFPPPRFASSRHAPAPGEHYKMMRLMHPSQLPPHDASHPLSTPFTHHHNDHYLAAGTIGPRHNDDSSQALPLTSHSIDFRRSTDMQKEYPAIASVDPKEAYLSGKTVITRSKWAWRDFPELEAFLVENRETYLQHSAMNYTQEQKEYNNMLTERLLQVAYQNAYVFHANDFDFVTVRDRIRCYYKSYVQANKKKGKIVSYPKVKRTLKADGEGTEEA